MLSATASTTGLAVLSNEIAAALLLAIPASLLLLGLTVWQKRRAAYRLLPPGPPSGLFGTKIPQPYAWRTFERWTREYGSVFTVWLGPKPLVVVGTYKAAMQIMERDSGVFADRPLSIMAGLTMAGDMRLLFVQYSDRWRRMRKMMHHGLQPAMAATYQPIQEAGARVFMNDILRDPAEFQEHANKYSASVIMTITYGKTTPTNYSDPEVQAVSECLSRVAIWARPGAALVDSYPLLRYFPGKWKTDGQAWHKEEKDLFMKQLDNVRQDVKNGTGIDCFGRYVIANQKEFQMNDAEAAYLAGSLFGAGSDTTASALTIAIMAMSLYPEKVKLGQDELDRVVGRGRLPTFNDQPDLPFIQAFCNEVHRWRPVSSGGFMHASLEEYHYDGYVFPKGCTIVGNHWAISRDPEIFTDPEDFVPERWFENEDPASGRLRKDIRHVQFGFGRRVCAGNQVASRSIFINVAMLLWAFNFGKKKDSSGNDIPIDTLAFTNAANSHPLPFKCDIQPRFEGVRRVLEEMDD